MTETTGIQCARIACKRWIAVDAVWRWFGGPEADGVPYCKQCARMINAHAERGAIVLPPGHCPNDACGDPS